jgi:hypothetical protein
LLFGPLGRLSYLTSTLKDKFEVNRVVGCRVVLLGNLCDSMRWDVLLAGREVRPVVFSTKINPPFSCFEGSLT